MIKVRISDESLNCYGSRIMTEGIDLTQYERNPVLLYMHERGQVVGVVKHLSKQGGELLGELDFDRASALSVQLEKQYEFGSLRMVSANLRIVETSQDKALLLEGQTRPTVTRSQLLEVSVVDIGGNDNALRLSDHDGNRISLAGHVGTECLLPLLSDIENNVSQTKKTTDMNETKIAPLLGLSATATEAEVLKRLEEIALAATEAATLRQENKQLREQQEQLLLSGITHAVDQAIGEKRVGADMRAHFVELGKKMGLEALRITLAAMQPQASICQQLRHTDAPRQGDYSQYQKLSAVPASQMDDLRDNHHEEYARLYKAEYGVEL